VVSHPNGWHVDCTLLHGRVPKRLSTFGRQAIADQPGAFAMMSQHMSDEIESHAREVGWATVLRGVLAVIFGVICLRNPNAAAMAFVIVFAIYAFADGLLALVLAGRLGRAGLRWGWYLLEGIASIALGVVALVYPKATLLALVFLVGLRAIVLGFSEVAAALSWKDLDSRWLLGLTGVLSVILGILLFFSPGAGGMALIWTIGVYAIVFGVMVFVLGVRFVHAESSGTTRMHPPTASSG
jgi:uncharacterized membrane protein HdeD (DUF308 family)